MLTQFHLFFIADTDHETDYEYEGSDNDEEVVNEGEPRSVTNQLHLLQYPNQYILFIGLYYFFGLM